MNNRQLTAFLHTRYATVVAALMLVSATVVAFNRGDVVAITGNRGLLWPSANGWIAPGFASMTLNLAVNVAAAFFLVWVNKAFNIMRALTALWGTFFLMFQLAVPMIAGQFYGGTVMVVAMIAITAVMFTCYSDPSRSRRVFLMFLILSAGSMIQYAFMFYVPLLFIGLAQMRVLTARTFVAAMIGLVTPPWIIFGSGLASLSELHWPEFVSTISALDNIDLAHVYVAVGLTTASGIFFLAANVVKLLNYNARFRAYNGFLSISMALTIVLLFVDYVNLSIYVPLLNMASAYQAAHFFSLRRGRLSYIMILSLAAVYLLVYLSTMFI